MTIINMACTTILRNDYATLSGVRVKNTHIMLFIITKHCAFQCAPLMSLLNEYSKKYTT